eukprot:2093912-Prymnesium_polylepis.1
MRRVTARARSSYMCSDSGVTLGSIGTVSAPLGSSGAPSDQACTLARPLLEAPFRRRSPDLLPRNPGADGGRAVDAERSSA